ncbi:hypothetical protein SLA2020_499840 [Shorea laevis]
MASISAAQFLSRSQPVTFSKPTSLHSLLRSQNPNLHLYSPANFVSRHGALIQSNFNPIQAAVNPASPATKEHDSNDKPPTLREICQNHVPEHVLTRVEEVGFVVPTDVQREALPLLFSGRDCILHAQTGSGKTLTYLLLIYSVINTRKSAVQALVVVPTRELGMQVTKVARMLAAKPMENEVEQKSCTVMALLDGGMLRRHKS